jgi:type 1 glutamine amidotransferase
VAASVLLAADAKVVLLAGKPSHPPGTHEYNAGMLLLEKCLRQNTGVDPVVVKNGWPEDQKVFDDVRAVVFYMDGRGRHEVLKHMDFMAALMKKGVGMGAIHYGVDVPPDTAGPQFLEWLGGFYDQTYSRNPMNDVVQNQVSPEHPISSGWGSFQMKDEWYYKIRFRPDDRRLVPILTAELPKEAPERETLAWAIERADGGRGFGFTGGHFHDNWGREEQRRLVVNAILWLAKASVPGTGALCRIEPDDLKKNLDDKPAPVPRKKK